MQGRRSSAGGAEPESEGADMRFGVNLMLWTGNFTSENLPLLEKAAKLGFDGVELPVFTPGEVDVAATKKALDDNGLSCTMCTVLAPEQNLISDDAKHRQAGIDHLTKAIELLAALGGDVICGPMYSPVGALVGRGRNDAEWGRAVECLQKVGKTAESCNVTVTLEPLNRFETYFLNIAADAVKLCKEVGSDAVKVHLDTFHCHIEEKDTPAAIRATGAMLGHFHACENDRGIPGSGQVDWDGVFAALRDGKYDGWLTMESFVPAIKELAAAAAIWRPFAKDGDELASEGLKFLKKMVG